MTKKKPTLREEITRLHQEIESSKNNQELVEEALSVLETQLQGQGWIRLFGSGKELTKTALNTLYDLGRAYWLKNPLIRRAVEVQALYVFAQGMTIKADHEPVDDVVQRFISDRKNYSSISSHQAWIQNERDLSLCGNLFFALFTTPETGRVIVRTIPFYEIADIICNPDDFKEPWYYRREFTITTFDEQSGSTAQKTEIQYYPDWKYDPDGKPDTIGSYQVNWDSPVYHVKTNCLPDMRFGVSEIYSAIDWAQAYKRFLENWGKLTEAYARFAWGITTKGGQAKVSAAKARMETLFAKTDPNTDEDLEGTVRTKQLPVGGVFTSTEGVTLNAIRTQGATTSMDDARRLMLMVASASGIPEQILTGDPSTGNLATAKAMERPLELQFRNRQTLWADVWWDLCQYVIDQAIVAGELPGIKEEDPYTGEITYRLAQSTDDEKQKQITWDISVTFPPLLEHDVLQTVQAIISAATIDNKTMAGTMDRKTLADLLLRALKVENVEEILEKLPEEPAYDRVTAPPAPDTGGFGGIDYTTESLDNLLKDTIKDIQRAARKLQEAEDPDGEWVTINGVHILIKDGESTADAFKRTTGKDLDQGGKPTNDGGEKESKMETHKQKINDEINNSENYLNSNTKILINAGLIDKDGNISSSIQDKLSPRETDTLEKYDWSSINFANYLRDKEFDLGPYGEEEISTEEFDRMDWDLEKMIRKSPNLPEGLTLYRGVGGDTGESYKNIRIGEVVSDRAYSSFTINPVESIGFTEIMGNKDGVAIRIKTTGKEDGLVLGSKNGEVILPKNTRIRVTEKDEVSIKKGINLIVLSGSVVKE